MTTPPSLPPINPSAGFRYIDRPAPEAPKPPPPRRPRPENDASFVGRLFRFIVLSCAMILSGVLLLGAAYRVIPPVSTLMLVRGLTFQGVERQWVPLEAISPALRIAVISAEDGRFCKHEGVDWKALNEVIEDAVEDNAPKRGASTLPMQTAKNLFLWHGRSYVRKGLELPIALYLDGIWPKRRMLEVYLNIAEWGDGIFGAEAASRAYFKKPASALTRQEAALLAAALPNPVKRNPARPSKYHQRYANSILARMSRGADLSCIRR